MRSRRILLGGIAVPAVVLIAVSIAWACVPQGSFNVNPAKGPAGGQVAASGSGFEAGQTVEIRWESRTGPLLAKTTGPSFSNVPVTIPASATPGNHFISAAMTGEHADHGATAVSFEVTAAAPPPEQAPGPGSQPVTPDQPSQQPAPVTPGPSAPAAPQEQGPSPRAKAIKRCVRKYNVKRAKTAAKRRRMAKKRKTCVRKAKRLSNRNASSSFNAFPFLRLLGR